MNASLTTSFKFSKYDLVEYIKQYYKIPEDLEPNIKLDDSDMITISFYDIPKLSERLTND